MARIPLLLSFLVLLTSTTFAATPKTVVLDANRLVTAKAQLTNGTASAALKTALADLTKQADLWLPQGPWAVTNKTIIAPNATIHDYASQAPYFWPSTTSSNGCPWSEKDGVVNPDSKKYTDHDERAQMFIASYVLSLAWWYTGKETYGRRAGDVLRTWFITNSTKMNPNLDHAQIVPCANTGRSIGIIDFSQGYTSVVDAAAILTAGPAPGWTAADTSAFQSWNSQFLNWLETSAFGKAETAATNNHGTFAVLQSAALALATGNTALATSKATAMRSRIDQFITANGSQPQELTRTRSFHYSIFDLVAYTRMADIGKKTGVGVDLWGHKGSSGQSIQQAVNFIIPAATGAKAWTFPELDFEPSIASDVIHSAADNGNAAAASAVAAAKVPVPTAGDLWLVRPASEQLDPST